jgi:hypothetical protein
MKRSIGFGLLLAGVLISHLPASAQVIGFKAGATFSNWSVENDPEEANYGRLTSFGAGGFLRFGLGPLILQPEVQMLTKGSKVNDIAGTEDDIEYKFDYLEIPVQVRLGVGGGAFTAYLLAGPTFSFELDCMIEADQEDSDVEFDCDDEEVEFFERKSFDLGATGAIGLDLRMGPGNLFVEGRYTHGFTNISEEAMDIEIKNRSFALYAGYSIPLTSVR